MTDDEKLAFIEAIRRELKKTWMSISREVRVFAAIESIIEKIANRCVGDALQEKPDGER